MTCNYSPDAHPKYQQLTAGGHKRKWRILHICPRCHMIVCSGIPHPPEEKPLKIRNFLGKKCVVLENCTEIRAKSHTIGPAPEPGSSQAIAYEAMDSVFAGFQKSLNQQRVPIHEIEEAVGIALEADEFGSMSPEERAKILFPKPEDNK